MLDLFPIDKLIPEDEEVARMVRHLLLNRAGGTAVMKAEHIWSWMQASTWEESPDP